MIAEEVTMLEVVDVVVKVVMITDLVVVLPPITVFSVALLALDLLL